MRGSQGLRPVVGCLLHLVFRFYLGLPHGHSGEGGRGGKKRIGVCMLSIERSFFVSLTMIQFA